MNDTQARLVRQYRVEHGCSYKTIARKYYEQFGETSLCKKPVSAIIHVDGGHTLHKFADGELPKTARVVEYLFDDADGKKLCNAAINILKEDEADGWVYNG